MSKKKTTEDFVKEVYNKYGDEYSVIGKYEGNKKKIEIKHNICENTFYPTPNNFLRGHQCFYCYGSKKITTDEFNRKIANILDDTYVALSEYTGSHNDIKILHKKCGHMYCVKPYSILQGHGCSWCNQLSIRENLICEYLRWLEVKFIPQYVFKWTYPKKYRYDFYLPDYNTIIEYNGEQHYREVETFKETLNFIQERDRKKLYLANKNNMKTIIIPYWLSDVEIYALLEDNFGGNE